MPEASPRKKLLLPLLVAALAAVALVVALLGDSRGEDDTVAVDSPPAVAPDPGADGQPESESESEPESGSRAEAWEQLASLARREADDPTARGDVDAPVVMIAYSDFQCPFCGRFARETMPELEDLVAGGTLRVEWRDFPYLGAESRTAALAARAAGEQDRFWEFHDALYAEQLPPNSGDLDEDHVVAVAEEVGLDVEQFRDDLDDPALESRMDADFAEGQSIGVTGTPSFLVNGRPIIGAQPVEAFRQAIEEAAAS